MKPAMSWDVAAFRPAAEALLKDIPSIDEGKSDADWQRVHRELQIYKIELDLQQEALRAAQIAADTARERYIDLFDFTPVAYFNLAADGSIRLVNQTGARLFGFDRCPLINQRFDSLFAGEERMKVGAWLKLTFAGSAHAYCEARLEVVGRPARTLKLEAILSSKTNECRVILIDVTEQLRLAEVVRNSEERFRALSNAMPNLAWIADNHGEISWYNARWYEYTGLTLEQSLGDGWQAALDPTILPAVLERWRRSVATGQLFEMEFPLRRADGSFSMFLSRMAPLKDLQGDIVQWFGTNTDITELKHSESIRLAVTGAEIGTWHWDVVRGTLVWSDQCEKIFGIPPATPMNYERFLAVLHPEDRQRADKAIKHSMKTRGNFDIELRCIWPDGSLHWVACRGRCNYSVAGKAMTMEGAARDVTSRKQAEGKINQLNADLKLRATQAQDANKDLEAFAYSVSHDLRAPLRAIDGFSRIVLSDFGAELPAEAQQYLQDIRENTKQMGKLVDDLLLFSRLGRKAVQRQTVHLSAMIQQCLIELKVPPTGERMEVKIGELPACQADPALIKQVWLNLLSNAVKYSSNRAAAIIEIGGRVTANEVEYFVKDNGVGFDMRYAHKLFGVFQRLHRAEEYAGTGVGLANVQRIIQRHGGRVWAEAEPDRGATFCFALPLERDES